MEEFGICYGHLVYFTAILWPFGIFMVIWYIFTVWVYCTKKNPVCHISSFCHTLSTFLISCYFMPSGHIILSDLHDATVRCVPNYQNTFI
jgi:hypothetical protein